MKIKTLSTQKSWRSKTVLVRVDFNVPITGEKIKDDFKVIQSLPTIKYLTASGAKVVLIGHLGRPIGQDKAKSLKPLAKLLTQNLKQEIKFLPLKDPADYWEDAGQMILRMRPGQVFLLENIRFFVGEEENKSQLARKIADLADIFVLDGFAVSHRSAASVSGVAKILPTYAGLLLEKEVNGLEKVMQAPKKPLVLVLGGAKMETKISLLKNFLSSASQIMLGGGIFNTYLLAKGYKVGQSLTDAGFKKEILSIGKNKKIIFPVDVVVGLPNGKRARVIKIDKHFFVPENEAIFDIGPETVRLFARYIKVAETLLWNGAMGYFEKHPYEFGTHAIAHLFASRSKGRAYGVAGGGETIAVLRDMKLLGDIDLPSTGGGALLEYLSGKKLPGVQAVLEK